MASISGSQFDATAGAQPVNVVTTSDGSNLPPPVSGQFNLEVFTGNAPYPTSPATGYDGLAILGPGGQTITLVSGAFETQDTGTGSHTLIADGDNETIAAGPNNNDILTANGNHDVVDGGGFDVITLNGNFETVNGGGNDAIVVYSGSTGNLINGGAGSDAISLFAGNNTVIGGSGALLVGGFGD